MGIRRNRERWGRGECAAARTALVGLWLSAAGLASGQGITRQAELVQDTFCTSQSGMTDSNYVSTAFNTNSSANSFYYGRDYSTVTRFGVLQWRLPRRPGEGYSIACVRLRIFASPGSTSPSSAAGILGFAKANANPDLSTITWNSAIAEDYIAGTDTLYRVALGSQCTLLSNTLSGGTAPAWFTLEATNTSAGGLLRWVEDAISVTESNVVTLFTVPRSGNGGTVWRGGHIEGGNPAEMEIVFGSRPALTMPVTNHLVVALQGGGMITNATGRVYAWWDSAPQGGWQDFAQGTASYQPGFVRTNMPNGRPAAVADFALPGNDYLELSATPAMNTNVFTWFHVYQLRTLTNGGDTRMLMRSTYSAGTTVAGADAQMWGSMHTTNGMATVHTRVYSGGVMSMNRFLPEDSTNQWFIMSGVWNGGAAPLNGNPATSIRGQLCSGAGSFDVVDTTSQDEGTANPSGHTRTRLGVNSWNLDYPFDGQMAEVLIYDTALSAADIRAVTRYLADKFLRTRGGTVISIQ